MNLRHTQHHRPGFTLIEILVTISIIALLAGLVIAAGVQMTRSAERSQTKVMLGQLAGVLTEYKVQTKGGNPDSTTAAPVPGYSGDITDFLDGVLNLGEDNPAERMLRSVDEQFWTGGNRYRFNAGNPVTPLPAIQDGWRNEIEYLAPTGENGDLTAAGNNQQPIRPEPYFASAGPDGIWGEFTDGDLNKPVVGSGAEDNLYSFQLDN